MSQLKQDHVKSVVDYLKRDKENEDVSLSDVMALAGVMTQSLEGFFRTIDTNVSCELASIASEIDTMKSEVVSLRPNDLKTERIPEAGKELDAVVQETEEATHQIIEAAEAIMELDATNLDTYRAAVEEHILGIFQACSFQDITGQRISKVVSTINTIEERISRFADKLRVHDSSPDKETDKEKWQREQILNGPQLEGLGVDQDDIDALFD